MTAPPDVVVKDFSTERRYQRRPDLTSVAILPSHLLRGLETLVASLRGATNMRPLMEALEGIRAASTPEVHLRLLAQVVGVVQALPATKDGDSTAARDVLRGVAKHVLFPWLLDCRVRYAHKALIGLAKTRCSGSTEFDAMLGDAFVANVLACDAMPSDAGNDANHAAATLRRNRVMHFINCMDAVTVTVVPVFRTVFAQHFVATLPLLADAANWSLDSAMANAASASRHHRVLSDAVTAGLPSSPTTVAQNEASALAENDALHSGGRVFGEDVDLLRFCVRVVATHVHKYLHAAARDGTIATQSHGVTGLNEILRAATRMLSSPLLPKDVLNAAGLLLASMTSLCTVHVPLLDAMCRSACAGTSQAPATAHGRDDDHQLCAAAVQHLLCHASSDVLQAASPLCVLAARFTSNGRFAMFKGLLSHFQSPLHGDASTLGALLRDDATNRHSSLIHDVMVPNAVAHTSEVQEPDTRFMAIQTLDVVVRHIAGVLREVATLAEAEQQLASPQPLDLFRATCTVTPKLRDTVASTVRMIMSLWDDPTQQVSGPLYDTYRIVLSINDGLARCHRALASIGCTATTNDDPRGSSGDRVLSPEEALSSVLHTQSDRRGKYHALLALVAVLPMADLLRLLGDHFHEREDHLRALQKFNQSLIAGACNSKICSVCGEVLAAMAHNLLETTNPALLGGDSQRATAWCTAFIEPVVDAAAGGATSFRGLNVSAAQGTSNVVAHMLTPLLKRWPSRTLADTLASIVQRCACNAGSTPSHVLTQVMVETLYRARNCGIDTSHVLHPNNDTVFPMVCDAMQSYEYELRNTAFGLAALSLKGAEAVEPWQCNLVERYVLMNLHQGGDSTARSGFLQLCRKWIRRLVDSITSSKTRTGIPADSKKQKQVRGTMTAEDRAQQGVDFVAYSCRVLSHAARLAELVVAHGGAATSTQAMPHSANISELAAERRYTALSVYAALTEALLPVFLGETTAAVFVAEALASNGIGASDVKAQMLPVALVPALLATLSEGWDKIRDAAGAVLELHIRYASPTLLPLLEATLGIAPCDQPSFTELLAASTPFAKELQSARFKECEGAVRKFVLCHRLRGSSPAHHVQLLHGITDYIVARCAAMARFGAMELYRDMQHNPLHGAISLACAVLGDLHRRSKALDVALGNCLMQCCRHVLVVCTTLVSGVSTEEGGNKIDCRGHVYQEATTGDSDSNGAMDTEVLSRIVVNNSWLGIRSATFTIEWVLQRLAVDELSVDEVQATIDVLVDALLKTKHNGVMSKSRQTLRATSAALLRSKRPEYHHMPFDCLDALLGNSGVTSDDEARVLRRSQGLPHAILPLLESEDASVPFSLFPAALAALLAAANESGATASASLKVAHRINALNVLKFIFDDKILGGRVIPFIQDAFVIAASGFRHANWAVRNSSLMLFSSVLHRFIGDHPSTGGGGTNASFHDVASRIPRGMVFVLEELESAVAATEATNHVQPGLFPVLLMLSMLTPDAPHLVTHVHAHSPAASADPDEHGSATGGKRDTPSTDDSGRAMQLVLRCRSVRNIMARGASAAALAGLVPVERLTTTIEELGAVVRSDTIDLNGVHGALLHLQRLFGHYVGTVHVDAPIRPSSRFHVALALSVLKATLRVLTMAREALVSASSKCPTVADVYLKLLCDVVYFSNEHECLSPACDEVAGRRIPFTYLQAAIACGLSTARILGQRHQSTSWNADGVACRNHVALFLTLIATKCRVVLGEFGLKDLDEVLHTDATRIVDRTTLTNRWNVVVWIGHHLAQRTGDARISAVPHRLKQHLFATEEALEAVQWFNGRLASTMPQTSLGTLYYGAMASIVQHHASSQQRQQELEAGASNAVATGGHPHPWSIAGFETLASVLQFMRVFRVWEHDAPLQHAMAMVGGNQCLATQLLHVLNAVPHSAAKSVAVQILAVLPTPSAGGSASSGVDALGATFADAIKGCAASSMPVVARQSAVSAIDQRLSQALADATDQHHHHQQVNPTAVAVQHIRLLAMLFRLLFDDDEGVRHRACSAATHHTAPRLVGSGKVLCHVSCIASIARLLKVQLALLRDGGHAEAFEAATEAARDAILGCGAGDADDAADDDANGDDDDNLEDGDALFDAEADNLFEESLTLRNWANLIVGPLQEGGHTNSSPGMHYASLMEVMVDVQRLYAPSK